MRRLGAALGAATLLVACGGGGGGPPWAGEKLVAADREPQDQFGDAVALSADGSTIVVGAPRDDGSRGAVYVYGWDGARWAETKLVPSGVSTADFDELGVSVAVSADGKTILAGTVRDAAAYVLQWDGAAWRETRLPDPGAGTADASQGFGETVALSPDARVAVVGSALGSTYLFERDGGGWTRQATLNTSRKASSTAISSDADTVVQGWRESSTVAVYRRDGATWTETLLQPSDGPIEDFGWSVSTSSGGDTLHVGAPERALEGAVYVYRWNGAAWVEQKVFASDGFPENLYGRSVSAAEDGTFVVGGTRLAAAYVVAPHGAGWAQIARVAPMDGGAFDHGYGARSAISADGTTVAVSAPEYWMPNEGGSVYVFRRPE
jgi:hypothetical protein